MPELVSISIYTLLISYTGIGNLCVWAERRLLAMPNERSSHLRPTPSGGGIAIVLTSLLGIILFPLLTGQFSPMLWVYLAGALIIALISWFDDLYTIASSLRFAVHSLGALLILLGVGYIDQMALPLLGNVWFGWLGFLLTFVWIVGLTNAYNFMDGIDGIAGSQAVIAGIGWALFGYKLDQPLILGLGLVLAASSLGFLGYNWPPARIFMGDVGSTFLGYSFAVLTVLGAQHDPRLALAGLLLVWPFVFDTIFTLVRRWRKGENIFVAHRSHLYQRLVISGYSHRTVFLLYSGLALIGAGVGIDWLYNITNRSFILIMAIPLLAVGLWALVGYREHAWHPVTLSHPYLRLKR